MAYKEAMKPLRNPYTDIDGYFCFGCSPENPGGLKMRFFEDGDEILCLWEPDDHLQGYFRVLHGGIQATLLDEIASWYVFVKIGTSGFTKSMRIEYLDQVSVDGGTVTLRAGLELADSKSAVMHCLLYQKEILKADAFCEYALFSPKLAEKRLHYPGADAFRGTGKD